MIMRRALREFVEQVLIDFIGEDEKDKKKKVKSKAGKKSKRDLLLEPDWSKEGQEDPANEMSTTAGVAGYTSTAAFDFSEFSMGPGPSDHLKGARSRKK